MIRALVFALTFALVYMALTGCAPRLASDLGLLYAAVIVGAWAYMLLRDLRRH